LKQRKLKICPKVENDIETQLEKLPGYNKLIIEKKHSIAINARHISLT
jgi:hypothetical protein